MVTPAVVPKSALPALDERAQDQFLQLVPAIRRTASVAFRNFAWSAREELIAETIANALLAFARLVARGKAELAYATPLASFAVRQVLAGRRVGGRLNAADVSSEYGRQQRGIQVVPLHQREASSGAWQERVLEDRRATPCELAIARLDIGAWLRQLPQFKRRIAECLATGERTQDAADRFQISPGRLSQLRQELKQSWAEFQREFRARDSVRDNGQRGRTARAAAG
jgi:hypothetical protein